MAELKMEIPETATEEITAMFVTSAKKAFDELMRKQSYPPYMTQAQASAYLGVSVTSFKKLVIPRVSLEGIERYSRVSLDKYALEHEI